MKKTEAHRGCINFNLPKVIKVINDGNLKPSPSDSTAMVLKECSLGQQHFLASHQGTTESGPVGESGKSVF